MKTSGNPDFFCPTADVAKTENRNKPSPTSATYSYVNCIDFFFTAHWISFWISLYTPAPCWMLCAALIWSGCFECKIFGPISSAKVAHTKTYSCPVNVLCSFSQPRGALIEDVALFFTDWCAKYQMYWPNLACSFLLSSGLVILVFRRILKGFNMHLTCSLPFYVDLFQYLFSHVGYGGLLILARAFPSTMKVPVMRVSSQQDCDSLKPPILPTGRFFS